jgi:hypothetical protein
MKKTEQGFIPIILIIAGVVVIVFIGVVTFMFFGGGLNSKDHGKEQASANTPSSTISPAAQKILDEGVDYRKLKCVETDLTGCDSENEGDNPTFID